MIYLDNAATTKPYKIAIEKSLKYTDEMFFNPSSLYKGGLTSHNELENMRESILCNFGTSFDLIFTSCGTESDNMAIYSYSKRGNIVSTEGEHPAIYSCYQDLKNKGYDFRLAKINRDGTCNIDSLLSLVDKNTTLVSVVHVNNETGGVNDINKISKLVKEINPRVVFHSDGVQAYGKVVSKVSDSIDLYSVSSHKVNGLRGVGCLFKNKKLANLKPYILGGGQENGLRSGTENTFGISVFNEVQKIHFATIKDDYNKAIEMKEGFLKQIKMDGIVNISGDNSSPYVLTLACNKLRGEVLQHMMEDKDIIIGTGSACSSRHRISRMLSMVSEYNQDLLNGVVRISFSRDNTLDEAIFSGKCLNECILKLKDVIL